MGNSDNGKTYRATDWKEAEGMVLGGCCKVTFLDMTSNYVNMFTINENPSQAFTCNMYIFACIYFNDDVVNSIRFLCIGFSSVLSHPNSVIAFVRMCADVIVS